MTGTTSGAGEKKMLQRVAQILGPGDAGVRVGIGDDAAVVNIRGQLVLTCDSMVEGTHFTLQTHTPVDIGYRSLAINLSDIAAMGARPRYCLVSMILPGTDEMAFIEEYYRGLLGLARQFEVSVVGGNLARSCGPLVIDITVAGEVQAGEAFCLSGARAGDLIMVTGYLGDSRAGLEILTRGLPGNEDLVAAHKRPQARLHEAWALGRGRRPSAVTDVSDGLAAEIASVCLGSDVGAVIRSDQIPVSRTCQRLARDLGADPLSWALSGGEDYEILFTAPKSHAGELADRVFEQTGTPVSCVGEITPRGEGLRLIIGEQEHPLPSGYEHF